MAQKGKGKGKEIERASRRNFPHHTLEEALALPQKIADEMGGKPFKRLLLSDALGIKPSSTNFRDLLNSSYKYGLTDGTEKANEIGLTQLGEAATQMKAVSQRRDALRKAAFKPEVFKKFYDQYTDRKIPSMIEKILVSEYSVPAEHASECSRILMENGKFTGIIRDIGGSPHILVDSDLETSETEQEDDHSPAEGSASPDDELNEEGRQASSIDATSKVKNAETPSERPATSEVPKAIFIGHGKNKAPLQKLQTLLSSFHIPHKVTIEEANLGRPIPQKVKDTMLQCGSAILIFTCDEKFYDENGNVIWRPSENVVHELGAASFAYGDRIVIFKEKGLHFPTNYQSVGYIEFEVDSIEARTTDLLKELIGFGLVKITPT
jgi:predicted nucleotide-binding protein